MNYKYAVICKDDDGFYVLATRQYWDKWEDALEWARVLAPTRLAIVIEGGFDQMRVADLPWRERVQGASPGVTVTGGVPLSAPSAREE